MAGPVRSCNLTSKAISYLETLGFGPCDDVLWMHVLAVGHSPLFLAENVGAIWQDWPRIPLPATRAALEASAGLGRRLAALLDVTQGVTGVTTGKIDPRLKAIGLITHVEGKQINDADDLAVTAGWGNPGRGGITMPAGGKAIGRDYAEDEAAALRATPKRSAAELGGAAAQDTPKANDALGVAPLGQRTFDIYLNDKVYWRNIPSAVWEYTLGGYQVIKKWLSYRERKLLGRALGADEARYVTEMSRRIAALILLQPELDENYRRAQNMGD
jgi:hypothetical protein